MAFDPDPITGDLQRYEAEFHPTADGATSGGDIAGSPNVISDASLGYIPTTPIPILSDPDLIWYYKEILRNESATDNLPAPKFFVRNGLKRPTSSGVFSLVSTAATKVRLTFLNSLGSVWDTEEIVLPAASTTLSLKSVVANSHVYGEIISGSGAGATLTSSTAAVFIARGSDLGLIPPGFSVSDSLHPIAIDDVINSSSSTVDRLIAPTVGVGSFSEAFSKSSALVIPGGLDLVSGGTNRIGLWWKIIRPNGMPAPIEKFQPILRVRTFL